MATALHGLTFRPFLDAWRAREGAPARRGEPKAPRYFDAHTIWEATGAARAFLRKAALCPQCCRALGQMYDRIGSTLFRDDDPLALLEAFEPEDRTRCTLMVLAASIVVNGRDRVAPTLH